MLGFALLFLTSKPVTLGSTVMAAGVSFAISNVYGDRNLFCACPAIDSYRDAADEPAPSEPA